MALYKSAQTLDIDDDIDIGDFDGDQVILYEDKPSSEDVIEAHAPMEDAVVAFKLPDLPGSEVPLEVSSDDDEEISEGKKSPEKIEVKEEIVDEDPFTTWKKQGPKFVLHWAKNMLQHIPRHSGHSVSGCERAAAFLERLQKELSSAIRTDLFGDIEIEEFEKIRGEIDSGIERLYDACKKMSKKKKTAEQENGIVKEGQKSAGFVVTVPIFISSLARTAINGTISAGHDIEKTVGHLVKEYGLSKREQLELVRLLSDMGYPVRRDYGLTIGTKFDPTSSDNYDFAANYPA